MNRLLVTSYYTCFFFFTSRRRHTRCSRDWSSDVCSSDLGQQGAARDDRHTRRVIPPVLQPAQPVHHDAERRPGARVTHDPAHAPYRIRLSLTTPAHSRVVCADELLENFNSPERLTMVEAGSKCAQPAGNGRRPWLTRACRSRSPCTDRS